MKSNLMQGARSMSWKWDFRNSAALPRRMAGARRGYAELPRGSVQSSGCSPGATLESQAPSCQDAPPEEIEALTRLVESSRQWGGILVVSGAGISTESGIADYRSPGRPLYKPMTHQTFVGDDAARRRYWARSMTGFGRLAGARPNAAHNALTALEQRGYIKHIITQNVDRLHQSSGSERVLELHGTIHEIECLECGGKEGRSDLQPRLEAHNPEWTSTLNAAGLQHRPDGDVDLPPGLKYEDFNVPPCIHCGSRHSTLKPSVIFHGGTLVPAVRDEAARLSAEAHSVLVVGSTLSVFSSFRIAREMSRRERPVAIVNMGETRADPLASLKIVSHTSSVLSAVAKELGGSPL